jgi:hypothetical protein
MLDRPTTTTTTTLDSREINRRAVALWPILRDHLVDLRGRPVGDLLRLSPNYIAQEAGRARPPGSPQLKEFRGPSSSELDGGPGAWRDVGTGQSGPDLVSLIVYLSGGADRRACAVFLSRLCDRMVVIK